MNTRRLLSAGALAAGMVLASTGAPAGAHDRVDAHGTVKVDPAGDVGAIPIVSGVFKSTEVLGLQTENINTVSLTLAPTGPTGGDPITANGCDFVTEGACGSGEVTYSWTPSSPAFNGPYEARATAVHCTVVCVAQSTARVTPALFRLGIAPKPPSELQATTGTNRSVSLSWARNPEPDMLYYAVFRKAPGGADFTRVGGDIKHPASGRASFSDTGTGDGGVLAYKVIAVRKGVSGDDKTTAASSASGERSVTVEAPVPTTVAVAPGQPGAPSQPPQAVPAGAGVSISGFLGSQPTAKPAPGPRYLDLPDTGFGTLPFDTPPAEEEILEDGEPVIPELGVSEDTGSSEEVSLTRPLVPVAAGAILLVLAAHMRLLSRKVKDAPVPSGVAAASSPKRNKGKKAKVKVSAADGVLGDALAASPYEPYEHPSHEDRSSEPYDLAQYEPYEPQPAPADNHYHFDSPEPDEIVAGPSPYGPESEWVEFEPPSILDSSAGGGSLMAPESIDSYTEAAAPYYEGVPSSETSSSAKDGDSEPGRRSTAVWRGPDLTGQFPDDAPSLSEALSLDDALSLDEPLFPDDDLYDFESLDAEEPTPSGAALQARHVEVDEAHLMGSFGFDDGLGEVPDDLVASEIPPTDEATSDAPAPTADDEAWEEEMIWEVVSPSR